MSLFPLPWSLVEDSVGITILDATGSVFTTSPDLANRDEFDGIVHAANSYESLSTALLDSTVQPPANTISALALAGITYLAPAPPAHSHVQADITNLETVDSPQFAGINIGHASDTLLTRLAAGRASVAGSMLLQEGIDYFHAYKSSDQTGIGDTFADLTSLSLGTFLNGVFYRFEYWLFMDSDNTTTGIDVAVNSAITANVLYGTVTYWTTANAITQRGFTAYDFDTASLTSNGTATRLYKIEGVIQLNGNGTLIARGKREAAGSGPACRAGSCGVAIRLG